MSAAAATPNPATVWDTVPATAIAVPDAEVVIHTLPPPPPTFLGTLWDKTKKEPFIPIGFFATCGFLTMGLRSMGRNDTSKQQFFMRGRVGAQAFTVAAFAYGLYNMANKKHEEQQKH